jgi:hypothetical protein
MSYDGLWSSILCDVSGLIVDICWGLVLPGLLLVLLESAKDWFLGVDPPKTTCVVMCPIWNDLLNKLVYSVTCLAGGTDYRFKCDTLEILKVQSGRVNCGTLSHCNATGMGLSVALPEP